MYVIPSTTIIGQKFLIVTELLHRAPANRKPIAVVMSPVERNKQRRVLREHGLRIFKNAADLVADRSTMLDERPARERLLAGG